MLLRVSILGLLLVIAGAIGVYQALPQTHWADTPLVPGWLVDRHDRSMDPADLLPLETEGPIEKQVEAIGRLSPESLKAYQRARLSYDIDRLASGQLRVSEAAGYVLYGPDWQQAVRRYKANRERAEYVLSAALLGMLLGAGTLVWCILLGTARLIIAGLKAILLLVKRRTRPQPQAIIQKDVPEAHHGRQKVPSEQQGRRKVSLTAEPVIGPPLSYNRQYPDEQTGEAGLCQAQPTQQACLAVEGPASDRPVPTHESVVPTLNQLNEQISALRQYAAQQQQRVERLQSGYDWNIIRTFCLKIIRCMDNLEDRILQQSRQGLDTDGLQQIQDELLFALEASGLEQFSPAVGSSLDGQYGQVEVASQKVQAPEPSLSGKVAQVIRPGYRYLIDHENSRVIRAARVRVYG